MQNKIRIALENAIAAMIDLLDEIDGDPDLEENGDVEPSIAFGAFAVVEVDLEGDGPAVFPEPSLPKQLSR